MLQDIDPLSVGVLFQNRYRIVRCLKGGPPTAVYDVVDEKTNACCLLEVAASGDVTMDNIGLHSEIEPCVGGLFETTLVDVPPLFPPPDVIASLLDPHESPLHASIEPLVVAAEQLEIPPSSLPQNSLRQRFSPHRRVFITLAIGMAIVALGLLALFDGSLDATNDA